MSFRTLDPSDAVAFSYGETSLSNTQVQTDLSSGLLSSPAQQSLAPVVLENSRWFSALFDTIQQPILDAFSENEPTLDLLSTQVESWLTDGRFLDSVDLGLDSSLFDALTGLSRPSMEAAIDAVDLLLNGGLSERETAASQLLSAQNLSTQNSFDDSLATARDIGFLSGTQTLRDTVGIDDISDYYHFDLAASSDVSVTMTGMSADADIQLMDSSGQVIEGSYLWSSLDETIVEQLSAGSYYLRVFSYDGSTDYSLNLSSTAVQLDGAGNSFESARNVGVLSDSQSFQDFVGVQDANDYYRFSVDRSSQFSLTMSGLSADADVELLDSSGQLMQGSYRSGSNAESIEQLLDAGSYYVSVSPYSTSDTDYSLVMAASAVANPDGAGNTLAAARDIGTLSDRQSFQDFVGVQDANDYYRFNLDRSSRFSLTMDGMGADADIELLNSNGELIQGSYGSSAGAESIEQELSVGSYYVRIYPYMSSDTDYSLTVAASAIADSDGAGNTLDTARNLGILSNSQSFQDAVGTADPYDYYRFQLAERQSFSLMLEGLSEDADVLLLDSSGQTIADSTGPASSPESIREILDSGTYYVSIYPYDTANTDYRLTLSASAVSTGFSSIHGYGLVDGAAAVASAIGQASPLPSVSDLGGNLWGADLVNAPEAWAQGYVGSNIVVAVVDSGVDTNHIDLRDNIWVNTREIANNGIDDDGNGFVDDVQGWDFVDDDERPQDENIHGTHVAGTIAAANNGVGVTGIAYGAQIMAVRVLDAAGSGSDADVAAGIRYAADNNADVINLSLGGDFPSEEIASAIQYATEQGSFVVAASGNKGDRQSGYPARYATDYGVAVGAVGRNRQVANFSNSAGSNDQLQYVVAPGVDVLSTVPGDRYESLRGTSMATPHVAGVVALMLSANAGLTHAQIRQILTESAAPVA